MSAAEKTRVDPPAGNGRRARFVCGCFYGRDPGMDHGHKNRIGFCIQIIGPFFSVALMILATVSRVHIKGKFGIWGLLKG